jgi:hypothetical protein
VVLDNDHPLSGVIRVLSLSLLFVCLAGIVVFWLIGLAQYQSRARERCAG